MQITAEIRDDSTLLVEVKVELQRVGETTTSDRVQQWCEKAGYRGFYDLDRKGLQGLANALRKAPTKVKQS